MNQKSRLTIDIDSDLHEKLKILAAQRRTSMREYCIQAIERRIKEDRADYLTAEEAPLLADLWDNDKDAVYDDL